MNASGNRAADVVVFLEPAVAGARKKQRSGLDFASAVVALARAQFLAGDRAQAVRLLDEVETFTTIRDSWLGVRVSELRSDLARQNNDSAAELIARQRAWQLLHDRLGDARPQTARYALRYAKALRTSGEMDRAVALERQSRPIFDQTFPADSAFRR